MATTSNEEGRRSVLIAPDSFKGSATAMDAAAALRSGWASVRPDDTIVLLPQADGGEGTLDAFVALGDPGDVIQNSQVTGPDGRPVTARWLLRASGEAVIEFAEGAGLPQMGELDALGATSRGAGEVIRAALDAGATRLTIGLGGSASTDGAVGAFQALGARFLDSHGDEFAHGGGALAGLDRVDRSALAPAPTGGVRLLTDVSNPLLGPTGAAAVFAPQKGASPEQVAELDAGLGRLAQVLGTDTRMPGAGAAGGAGYGFASLWGAEVVPGAAEIAALTGLDHALDTADVAIFGEGRFDATSSDGKVVGRALARVRPSATAVVVAGRVDAVPLLADGRPAIAIELVELAGSEHDARADAVRWLREAGAVAARLFDGRPPA